MAAPGGSREQGLQALIEQELLAAEARENASPRSRVAGPRRGTASPGLEHAQEWLRRGRLFLTRHNLSPGLVAKVVLGCIVFVVVLSAVVTPLNTGNGANGPTRPPLPSPRNAKFFNAHHSPVGAWASFTLGYKGASGGLGLELAGPANQNVYVLLDSRDGTSLQALPFFPIADSTGTNEAFFSQMGNALGERVSSRVVAFADEEISRRLSAGTDTWSAGDLSFRIYSPVREVPDPNSAAGNDAKLQAALVPAVLVELTVDNSMSDRERRVVFGYQGSDLAAGARRLDGSLLAPGVTGIAHGLSTGIATDAAGALAAQGFALGDVLGDNALENRTFALGNHAVLVARAAPRSVSTFRYAVAFHRGGRVTSGIDASYYYTRWWDSLEAVAAYALGHFAELKAASLAADSLLEGSSLSLDQRFSLAMAIRSYYGSTQLLLAGGKPVWVVNEGEYRMTNTFDLTVDQLFFELRMNPWTVRNVLDTFTHRYSYTDTVVFPAGEGDSAVHPGGLSFTHDQGVANAWTPSGQGSYEQAGLVGLFSFMTHEQLVNWVLCATAYVHATGDGPWLDANTETLQRALASLLARDHPDAAQRDGLMSLDSTKCAGGAEITTYDSLDASLGRARGNVYLGGKTWAAYVALEHVFFSLSLEEEAATARGQADKAAATMTAALTAAGANGHLPAVLGRGGSASAILPAIEGLAFPRHCGAGAALDARGRYKDYLAALKQHLQVVLRPGVCLFRDGGWKLSSTSDNSWLSKVYLAQYVARAVLGLPAADAAAVAADAAHAAWLLHPRESYYAWSDQMLSGVAIGSRYYPRGVTAILWLDEAAEGENVSGR